MKKIGFLISGEGSTLKNFIEFQKAGKLNGEISVVVSSKKEAKGLEWAREAGIPAFAVEYKNYKGKIGEYSREITSILEQYGCDIVVMGGFLSFYEVPEKFRNKVLNIHPSLIPAFCGEGFYGRKVYEKILESGVKITGCTVHLVDNEYDAGPILAQEAVSVLDDDTLDTLSERVQAKERELYPRVVNEFLDHVFEVWGGKTKKRR